MSNAPKLITEQQLFYQIHRQFMVVEREVLAKILKALSTTNPMRQPVACNAIFGRFTQYMRLCVAYGFASRAASFSVVHLIPKVLKLEQQLSTQFHKGALFYDTGLAHLLAGNEDGYERFLAMADEEDYKSSGGSHKRGSSNLRRGHLPAQTISKRMQNACALLNGKVAGNPADYGFMTGLAPVNPTQFDEWRQKLNELHQFELLRVLHDVEVFVGVDGPIYPPAADNPFIMLRLGKTLSHLAQWVESCLTQWQGGGGDALSKKLKKDPDFGATLSKCAGSEDDFAGHSPKSLAVDSQLHQLLVDLAGASVGAERQWRLLRILYIVRNSTAHTIEPNLAMYQDRAFLLNLLQVVFVSAFVICQLKRKPMPLP